MKTTTHSGSGSRGQVLTRRQAGSAHKKLPTKLWVALLVIGGLVVASAAAWSSGRAERVRVAAEASLGGRWQRPDGGYVIEIRGADRAGQLAAGYFNPNPIHVARAEWKSVHGRLAVFLELRDRNYPGATYRLDYAPESDTLRGTYHQPLVGQSFEVEFARAQ